VKQNVSKSDLDGRKRVMEESNDEEMRKKRKLDS
jgi:hypothetical protein